MAKLQNEVRQDSLSIEPLTLESEAFYTPLL